MSGTEGELIDMPRQAKQEVATRPEQSAPAIPQTEAGAVLSLIERAARDPSIDIDKMERLMRMHQEVLERKQEREFFEAMGRCQAEIPQVVRDAVNDHTKSKYARLESIAKAITPVVTKHGFSMSFGTEDSPKDGHHRVVCLLAHAGGYAREYRADLPADIAGSQGKANKTAIQAFGSTVSYGRRYLTLMIFNVALTNEDDDGEASGGAETITDDQAAQLRELIEQAGASLPKLIKMAQIERLEDMPAKDYDAAVKTVREYGLRKGTLK
jgi:hypothetical protein